VKNRVSVTDAPQAIGPYSQGQLVRLHGGNRMLFTSGQIALDPAKGEIVGADVKAQTERVFKNLAAVLRGAGLGFADVVKTTVYLTTMDDFAAMNEVYGRHFGDHPPARTTVAVAALPKGGLVEIDAVAIGRDL